MKRALLWLTAGLWAACPLPADGELVEQIELVSQQIRSAPQDPSLYLQRADLLRRWRRLETALGDLRQAERWNGEPGKILSARARILRDAGHGYRALAAYGRSLDLTPDDTGLRWERARLLHALGRPRSAARDLERIAAASGGPDRRPEPDLYVSWHIELVEAGLPLQALAALDAGIQRLGPLVSLEVPAFELERSLGQSSAALRRLDRLTSNVPRMDGWLLARGQVLRAAERTDEARSAYQSALDKLRALSPRRQRTQTARTMLAEAENALRELQ